MWHTVKIQNKKKNQGSICGRKSGEEQKVEKWNVLWLSNLVRGTFVKARESERSVLLAAPVVQPTPPCQKAWNLAGSSVYSIPTGPSSRAADNLGTQQFTEHVFAWEEPRCSVPKLKPHSDTSPKKLLEGNRVQVLLGLSFLIKGEVIAVCLVRSGQIDLIPEMLNRLPTSI